MKSEECEKFAKEIGAFLASGGPLAGNAAQHSKHCARCRSKLAELERVAALHQEFATNLPEPKRRLHRQQLERALEGKTNEGFQWMRPALAGFTAILILIAAVVSRENSIKTTEAPIAANIVEPTVAQPNLTTLSPTILTLHKELEKGNEMLASTLTTSTLKHYRVRDVGSELRN